MSNRIAIQIHDEDFADLERVSYEATTVSRLIDFHFGVLARHGESPYLTESIARYQDRFTKASVHRDMLINKIVERYFPYDKGWVKEMTKYNIDFERGEIVFTNVETTA